MPSPPLRAVEIEITLASPEVQALRKDAERYRWLRGEADRDYIEFQDVWYEDATDLELDKI